MSRLFRHPRPAAVAATLAATAALTLPLTAPAVAGGPGDRKSEKLQERVTFAGVLQHLQAFQRIADANDGTRAAGTPGYAASVDYVVDQMQQAGYEVHKQAFPFDFFTETADPVLTQTAPDPTQYAEGDDFATMTFSGSGDVTEPVQAVDLALTDPASSTSGCEAADFSGFTAGNVALIQRGACTFAQKAENAEAAGATGVVIFNQGNGEDRKAAFAGTLGGDVVDIPVLGASFAVGQDLADPAGTTVHMFTQTVIDRRTTYNVIAQTTGGDPDNVVMLGAHLDSVPEGPGINDNGSGSATLVEVARQMAKVHPRNQVRFAWWGAEELGLVGSTQYVDSLTPAQREEIALYLNFDMIGSPNYYFAVYDGDGSAFGTKGPAGSDAIEHNFAAFFAGEGVPSDETAFDGRSDYLAFIDNGIPAGGLFTGADGTKTAENVADYGGVEGAIFDPCYHQACDSTTPVADGADRDTYAQLYEQYGLVGNIAPDALDTNADAIADAVMTYAFDTSSVTGTDAAGQTGARSAGGGAGGGAAVAHGVNAR